MRFLGASLLALGLFWNSVLAYAEGPVPFRSLMQTAGSPSGMLSARTDQQTQVATPTPPTHLTHGGKAMIGSGIGLVAIGGGVIIMTAILNSWATPGKRGALYGGGGGVAAAGVTLIVLGNHRRSAQ